MPNRRYDLCEADSVRIIGITLLRFGAALATQPTTAVLRFIQNGAILDTRDMEYDADSGEWQYQFEDEDFTDFPKANYKGKIFATFSDGRTGTWPTRGYIEISILRNT